MKNYIPAIMRFIVWVALMGFVLKETGWCTVICMLLIYAGNEIFTAYMTARTKTDKEVLRALEIVQKLLNLRRAVDGKNCEQEKTGTL